MIIRYRTTTALKGLQNTGRGTLQLCLWSHQPFGFRWWYASG